MILWCYVTLQNAEVGNVGSFFNTLLILCFGASMGVLLLQGFGLPALPAFADLCLRVLAAASGQWLACRIGRNSLQRGLPLAVTFCFAVWGFFLLLTAPSWQHATLPGFLADYASPALACSSVWWLYRKYYR